MSEVGDALGGIRHTATGKIITCGARLGDMVRLRDTQPDPDAYELVERHGDTWIALPPGYENDIRTAGNGRRYS